MISEKVFAIGFHKTGTKSLAAALAQLGYRVHGPQWVQDPHHCASIDHLISIASTVIDEYDAFQDNPWPVIWQYLVKQYPRARYILTVRDSDAWVDSACRYFGTQKTPMRALIYGADAASPLGFEERYKERYNAHNKAVREYFSGKDNFLEMNVAHDNAWANLCTFLNKPIIESPFPHANPTAAFNHEQ